MIPYSSTPPWPPRVLTGSTPEEKLAGIKQCLRTGDRIQAVEIYGEWKGVDLPEAIAAVEQLDREFMATQPFLEYAWRKGWIGVLVVIAIAIAALLWL